VATKEIAADPLWPRHAATARRQDCLR